jgi:hypothetical protein
VSNKCDEDIYENGRTVLVIGDEFSVNTIEAFVQKIARRSGQKVDWHFIAGRAALRAKANTQGLHKVDEAIYGCPDEVAAWWKAELEKSGRVAYKDCIMRCTGGLLLELMTTKKPSEATGTVDYCSPLYGYHPGGDNHWARDELGLEAFNMANKVVVGALRQHVPVAISWVCPGCQTRNKCDYSDEHYFADPKINAVFAINLCCPECSKEVEIFVKLHLTLSLHARLENG